VVAAVAPGVAVLTGAVGETDGVPVQAMTSITTTIRAAMGLGLRWVKYMPPPCKSD
jgi:hypothetical protein